MRRRRIKENSAVLAFKCDTLMWSIAHSFSSRGCQVIFHIIFLLLLQVEATHTLRTDGIKSQNAHYLIALGLNSINFTGRQDFKLYSAESKPSFMWNIRQWSHCGDLTRAPLSSPLHFFTSPQVHSFIHGGEGRWFTAPLLRWLAEPWLRWRTF